MGMISRLRDFPPGQAQAAFSLDGHYRYELIRRWDHQPFATWVMLNPSTADAVLNDATIRRCMGFTKRWNLGGIVVVNLFAARTTYPEDLKLMSDPVGPDNDQAIHDAAVQSQVVVVAWGAHSNYLNRDQEVLCGLSTTPAPLRCLGKTKNGQPLHPLRLSYNTTLQEL